MSTAVPPTWIGVVVALLLALAGVAGGFGGFCFALVLGAVGYLVGAQAEGKIDVLGALSGRGRG
ncbi:hypothetical protein [Quadrisphaera sp. INWT6]|uniref:hypothetical protein n=1 Tax=Quadrisphaera sp. INWT6 TaxID=2596917 RepID=UPI0018926736|nr:hypothetical protein [Quadrisphaera sp. INWT6]MBF5081259.1 hypothetical protein [Quadrisphaera sp. INWT6]